MGNSSTNGYLPGKTPINNNSFNQLFDTYLEQVKSRYESNKSLQEAIKELKKQLSK